VKLSDAEERSMLTVLPSAETGWQVEVKGLHSWAAVGRAKMAVARAAAALIVDRIANVVVVERGTAAMPGRDKWCGSSDV
jgi:hypothetical protein